MTFEEAKEVFINRGFVNGLFDGDKWRESVVIISKWLEQEDCENRMVAILTEIQTKIESVPKYSMTHDGICVYRKADEYIADVNKVIQQKIDALKMESEGEDRNDKGYNFRKSSKNICTQKCCLKNHNVGIIECNEEYCSNRTTQ